MAKFEKQELLQAGSCLLCLAVASLHLDSLGNSEFIGGWLTGPLFTIADYGTDLLIPAIVLTFFYPRITVVIALMGSLLYLPLNLYLIAPGLFRLIFKGEYSVPPRADFVWNNWAIAGIASLLLVILFCLRSLFAAAPKIDPMDESSESR